MKDSNENKYSLDLVEIEDSLLYKMKHENEKKCLEDVVDIEDSNSLDKLKHYVASIIFGTIMKENILANWEEAYIQNLVV